MADTSFSDWLQNLKYRIDIVDVIGGYVQLNQKGGRFWACCPFHHEKTPSFCIDPQRQSFKCFGCGVGGDAIKFVMDAESVDFMDAVRFLAEKYGVAVPEFSRDKSAPDARAKKDRLFELMKSAARHYYDSFDTAEGQAAAEYLKARGFSDGIRKKFGIGASLGFNQLVDFLKGQGYTAQEMIDAGVAEEKNGRLFDAMHGRLIIPVIDVKGNVIAFCGRVLEPTDFAKYKNTKETPVFLKNRELFGVHALKRTKLREPIKDVVLVEGHMDVIALYAAGIKNALASMGTSLTVEQARLLKRFSDNVYLCYDGDSAGRKAAERGVDLLVDAGLNVKVISLPDKTDPDDYVKQYGADMFYELKRTALPLTEYRLRVLAEKYDLKNTEERGKFVAEASKILSGLKTTAELDAHIALVKEISKVPADVIKRQTLELKTAATVALEAAVPQKQEAKKASGKRLAYYEAVRFMLFAMFADKPYANAAGDVSPYLLAENHKKLYDLYRLLKSSGSVDLDALAESDNDEAKVITGKKNEYEKAGGKTYFDDCVLKLKKLFLDIETENLTKQFDTESDPARRKELLVEIQKIKSLRV